jgi:hypothetical protein
MMDEEKLTKNLRLVSKIMLIFCLVIILFGLYILPVLVMIPNPPFIEVREFNLAQSNIVKKIVGDKYRNEIYPKGKEILDIEIQKISQIEDPNLKLDEIFRWEMHDWHNPNWEIGSWYYYNNSPFFLIYKEDNSKLMANPSYEVTLLAPKTPNGIFYDSDPYWIAYHKVGACESLSTLFAFMAQQSGFKSRTVQTINHQWAEVKINGKWMYYDPWCAVEHNYYNPANGNFTFKDKWFNNREYFRDNCLWYASFNFYNDAILPNHLATIEYSISYTIHDFKKLRNFF